MKKVVVVISGPPSAGSSTISKKVAKRLNLRYFSFGKLQKKLVKGWKKNEAEAALESWKTPVGASVKTHKERDALQARLAKEGNIVICGKLSIHFLKRLTPYKIWLDVPLKVRAERAAKRDGTAVDVALKQIAQREDIERLEWRKMYGFDYFNQKYDADMVVDSSDLTVKQTVDKITAFVRGKK